jgi:hypothetical protein
MNKCCDRLEDWFDEPLERFYQLHNRLEMIGALEAKFIVYYRCKACGQLWEEHREPFNRIEVCFVLKSFPDESGRPRELDFDYHQREVTFQDTGERLRLAHPGKEKSGCLLSWLM